ncbi:MAG: ATP-binding protein [Streptosporangiaceae bacterium]
MLLTPADRGPGAQPARERPAQAEGWLAAPVSELTAPTTPRAASFAQASAASGGPVRDGGAGIGLAEAGVRTGGCFVRPLPLDNTCAGAARRLFREAVAGSDLPSDLIHDGVTMASELAANTTNAHGNIEFGASGRPASGMPEIWLYLRHFGSGRELVCKIFDSEPGWDAGEPLPVGAAVPAGPDSVRGRGLQMVAGLSAGRWGHHLSRGRLGAWKVQGKAVWFALRVPPGSDLATSARVAPRGSRAIAELAAALADRGLGAGLVPVTEPRGDLAVLSVSTKLTVWCRGEVVWWQEPQGGYDRLPVSDLVEAAERIVCAHEELIATRTGNEGTVAGDDQPGPAGA